MVERIVPVSIFFLWGGQYKALYVGRGQTVLTQLFIVRGFVSIFFLWGDNIKPFMLPGSDSPYTTIHCAWICVAGVRQSLHNYSLCVDFCCRARKEGPYTRFSSALGCALDARYIDSASRFQVSKRNSWEDIGKWVGYWFVGDSDFPLRDNPSVGQYKALYVGSKRYLTQIFIVRVLCWMALFDCCKLSILGLERG